MNWTVIHMSVEYDSVRLLFFSDLNRLKKLPTEEGRERVMYVRSHMFIVNTKIIPSNMVVKVLWRTCTYKYGIIPQRLLETAYNIKGCGVFVGGGVLVGGSDGGGVLGNSKENQSEEEDEGILVISQAFGPTNKRNIGKNDSWAFLHCHIGFID
ncbi:hypothetical protein Tco_0961313 [Tanacetum coccineum]